MKCLVIKDRGCV